MNERSSAEMFGAYRLLEEVVNTPVSRTCRAEPGEAGPRVLLRIFSPLASLDAGLSEVLEELKDTHNEFRVNDAAALRIRHVGKQAECWYVVQEDFAGVPLDEFLHRERLAPQDALGLSLAVAQAVRGLHAQRLVHGSLTPKNVLVARSRTGRFLVKIALVDAALGAIASGHALQGARGETMKYLAPEKLLGRAVSQSSDVFALGVMFYELFSGRPPFGPEGALGEPAQPLAMIDSAVSADLSRVVARMLERDPNARYRRTDSLVADLERVEARGRHMAPELAPAGSDSAFAGGPAGHVVVAHAGPWRGVALAALALSLLCLGALVMVLINQNRQAAPRPAPIIGPIGQVPATPAQGVPGTPAPSPGVTPTQSLPVTTPVAPTAPPATTNASLAEAMAAIDRAVATGKTEVALKLFTQTQTEFPGAESQRHLEETTAPAIYQLAERLYKERHEEEAVTTLAGLARALPRTQLGRVSAERGAEILYGRAAVHESRGEVRLAATALERLIQDFPTATTAPKALRQLPMLRARGAQAILTARPADAIEELRAAAASAAGDDAVTIRNQLTDALMYHVERAIEEGDMATALEEIAEIKRIDPKRRAAVGKLESDALYRRAFALKAKGDFAGALTTWDRLKKQYPTSEGAAKGDKAMRELIRQVGKAPRDNPQILLTLAERELEKDDLAAARVFLETILTQHPTSPPAKHAADRLARWDLAPALEEWRAGQFETAGPKLKTLSEAYPQTTSGREAALELRRFQEIPDNMVYVPGGEFAIGLTDEAAQAVAERFRIPSVIFNTEVALQKSKRKVATRSFYIDRHEVTNAQYAAYLKATGKKAPLSPAWEGADVRKGFEQVPVTHVTLQEALAYATWAKKRLPTEPEWEKAARGVDGRLFPWGDDFDTSRTITAGRMPRPQHPAPVGSAPTGRSPYGVEDMAGNVQEWTRSIFRPYDASDTAPVGEIRYAVRGAGWHEMETYLILCTARWAMDPNLRTSTLGFRCVQDVAQPEPKTDVKKTTRP